MVNGYFFSDSETGAPFTPITQIGTDKTLSNITLNVFACKRNVRHACIGCPEDEYILG